MVETGWFQAQGHAWIQRVQPHLDGAAPRGVAVQVENSEKSKKL
jgi:hypothetical protein